MGGGFGKEGGVVGPIAAGLDGVVLLGGKLIYMGLRSLAGEEEEGSQARHRQTRRRTLEQRRRRRRCQR